MNAQKATQLTKGRSGCGSLNIAFDLYLDAVSNSNVAFSAEKLNVVIRKAIKKAGMTLRKSFIDPWESVQEGPATLFYSLEESHVRIETWPAEGHLQGEVQLCNFSKNNEKAAQHLAECIIGSVNPETTQVLFLRRGPGPDLLARELVKRRR
ncbi:MAG TPA: S-adenosylmethionine decarboxylase [Candidatus Paceibacterota bacterium]|nr:S-adenosylmethionine decarboxylase [Candidatus Paceibacterota bacterium]